MQFQTDSDDIQTMDGQEPYGTEGRTRANSPATFMSFQGDFAPNPTLTSILGKRERRVSFAVPMKQRTRFQSPLPTRESYVHRFAKSKAGGRYKLVPSWDELAHYAFWKVYDRSSQCFAGLADWTLDGRDALFHRVLVLSTEACDRLFAPFETFLGISLDMEDRVIVVLFAVVEAYAVFLGTTTLEGALGSAASGVSIVVGFSAVVLFTGIAMIAYLMTWSIVEKDKDLTMSDKGIIECQDGFVQFCHSTNMLLMTGVPMCCGFVCPMLRSGTWSRDDFTFCAKILPLMFGSWMVPVKHLADHARDFKQKQAVQAAEKKKEFKQQDEVQQLRQTVEIKNTLIQNRDESLEKARKLQLAAEDRAAYLRQHLGDTLYTLDQCEDRLGLYRARIHNSDKLESELKAKISASDSVTKDLESKHAMEIQQLKEQNQEANWRTLHLSTLYREEVKRMAGDTHARWDAYHGQELNKWQATLAREKGLAVARTIKCYTKQIQALKDAHLGEIRNAWANAEFFHRKHVEAEAKLQKLQGKLHAAEERCDLLDEQDVEAAVAQAQQICKLNITQSFRQASVDIEADPLVGYVCLGPWVCDERNCFCRNLFEEIVHEEPVDVLLEHGFAEEGDFTDMEGDLVSLGESDCDSMSEVEWSSDEECDDDFHA